MSDYRRHYVPGGTWFFTVNLRDRRSDLLIRHIDTLRHATLTVKHRQPFHINAWVILPEHMHCIWTLPANDDDFSGRWRELKKAFSKSLRQKEIWQPRFWEHTIRDERDYRHHMNYVYINPVKHGLVKCTEHWPFSTFHRDVRAGVYPKDWAGEITDMDAGERR